MMADEVKYDRDLQEKLGTLVGRMLSPTVAEPLSRRMEDLLSRLDQKTRRYN